MIILIFPDLWRIVSPDPVIIGLRKKFRLYAYTKTEIRLQGSTSNVCFIRVGYCRLFFVYLLYIFSGCDRIEKIQQKECVIAMKWFDNVSYGNACFDLCLPDKMPAPLFLYFHGGGLEAGDKADFRTHAETLASRGIACATANYRMYPTAKFPDYLEDSAACFAYLKEHADEFGSFTGYYMGGSSAGGYICLMLYFDPHYLGKHGIAPDDLNGYVFDAGQPTTHFNVLRERGLDTRAIRVDEAAPLYFIDHPIENPLQKSRLLFLAADNDIVCRLEQHRVMLRTMFQLGYSTARVEFKLMSGYSHCQYDGSPVFADIISEFIRPDSAK